MPGVRRRLLAPRIRDSHACTRGSQWAGNRFEFYWSTTIRATWSLRGAALDAIGRAAFAVETAGSLAEASEQIGSGQFDVALLDLSLPDCTRSETLVRFRKICGDELPIIVLTGLMDKQLALEAVDCGAQDYIGKDDVTPNVLSRSIRYALARQNLLLEVKTTNNLLAEKNARLAQLCDTAQQFVENVSHEFRTPLTVIREFTSIIRDGLDGPVTAKQAEHLNKVLHRTDDLALMVDDMLDASKLGAGLLGVWRKKCQAGDLIENVAGLLRSRAASKRIKLSTEITPDLPLVFCDEEKARRVIMNLAVNAIKFAAESGNVEIWRADAAIVPTWKSASLMMGQASAGRICKLFSSGFARSASDSRRAPKVSALV